MYSVSSVFALAVSYIPQYRCRNHSEIEPYLLCLLGKLIVTPSLLEMESAK